MVISDIYFPRSPRTCHCAKIFDREILIMLPLNRHQHRRPCRHGPEITAKALALPENLKLCRPPRGCRFTGETPHVKFAARTKAQQHRPPVDGKKYQTAPSRSMDMRTWTSPSWNTTKSRLRLGERLVTTSRKVHRAGAGWGNDCHVKADSKEAIHAAGFNHCRAHRNLCRPNPDP